MSYSTDNNILKPYLYPFWIQAFALVIALLFSYSFYSLPASIKATLQLERGESLLREGQYQQAIADFEKAYEYSPTAKKVKIALATAYFSNQNSEDDRIGLLYLEGVSIDDAEWSKVSVVIPEEYKHYFGSLGSQK